MSDSQPAHPHPLSQPPHLSNPWLANTYSCGKAATISAAQAGDSTASAQPLNRRCQFGIIRLFPLRGSKVTVDRFFFVCLPIPLFACPFTSSLQVTAALTFCGKAQVGWNSHAQRENVTLGRRVRPATLTSALHKHGV